MSIKIIYDEQDVWKCSTGGSGMVLVRIGASRRGVGGKSVALRNGDQEDWEMANGGRGPLIIRGRSVVTGRCSVKEEE